MLNYKAKSHRGRSPSNHTDALCIVEAKRSITRVFAKTIPDKKASTLIPIICSQVADNSVIWTDEHRSYGRLNEFSYTHESVCHKYEFVNYETGVNTQAVESFNNCLKLEIKKLKGVEVEKRDLFLKEVCFLFNNKGNVFDAVCGLIKF
jgi:transposase-like protein